MLIVLVPRQADFLIIDPEVSCQTFFLALKKLLMHLAQNQLISISVPNILFR